jgi:histidine ammonia-lyase
MAEESVAIAGDPLSIDDLLRIARGARVELGAEAMARIEAGRAVVDRLVDGPELVYGLNTGLGHERNRAVPRDTLRRYQEQIVDAHEGAVGAPLPTTTVRAAMAVRLAGIARGGSGASPAVARALAALLNGGVHPVVPETGSVGAGDLMHMASIARVLVGRGRAEVGGRILDGAEALAAAGLEPVALEPKDGLALISANGVSIALAALAVDRARRAAAFADLALATTLEVTAGNLSILDPAALRAKPLQGQLAAGTRVAGYLAGSRLHEPDPGRSVQDPLSVRVGPQVHGAFLAFVDLLADATAIELAAMDDNPLVDVGTGRMISNGNFHPMHLALTLDALRPAIAHVGQLSDRRMNHLWAALAGVFMDEALLEAALDAGGGFLRYTAASLTAELRIAVGPATLDVAPLDFGVEDHATNAPFAGRLTDRALATLEGVLGIELLMARAVARVRPPERLAPAIAAAFAVLDAVPVDRGPGRTAAPYHAAVVEAIPALLEAAGDAA